MLTIGCFGVSAQSQVEATSKAQNTSKVADRNITAESTLGARSVTCSLTEGFDSSFPSAWTNVATNANENWTYVPTGGNPGGYMDIVYDDAVAQQDESIITPAQDLSALANPILQFDWFASYYWSVSPNNHYDLIVSISTDGGLTYTQLWSEEDEGQFSSFTWYTKVIDLSAYASETAATFKFNYYGLDGAQASLDNISVCEQSLNDLVLKKVFHGNIMEDWEYEITPLAQVQSKVLGVIVNNSGAVDQTNVVCEYDILLGGNSVASGTFPVSSTLLSNDADTVWHDTGFTPSEIGVYTVSYNIVSNEGDDVPANNTEERVFEISQYEWSHEREALWDGQYGGYVVSAADQTLLKYSQGSVFVPVATADLYAIKVSFGSRTTATSSSAMALTVEVHTIGQSIQEVLNSEVQGVEIYGTGWQTFVLDNPITLEAGVGYILAVTTEGGTDEMTINGWGVDSDFGAANYGPFGANAAVNWFNGWDYSSAIRAVFDPTLGIKENADVTGFNIYPNPTNDNLNINFVSKEDQNVTVNVIGVDGALVYSKNLNTKVGQVTKTTIDVTDLAKGIYMVQLVGTGSSITQRVVVQ